MSRHAPSFTLVEMLIVVLLLGIISMIVIPRFTKATDDAREAALVNNLVLARKQIDLYKVQHGERAPHLNESGAIDVANFVDRLTGRTDPSGKLNAAGSCGPYLTDWPSNPFSDEAIADKIQFHGNPNPPRSGFTGWYYCVTTDTLYVNSAKGARSIQP